MEIGDFGTIDYKLYYNKNKSYWHDIPLINENGYYNVVIEISKRTREKMEMSKEIKYNPIINDTILNNNKKEPRYLKYGPIPFNYGFIPQTWESPKVKDSYTNLFGDDDPLDFVDIGDKIYKCGDIITVKIIGILGVIDEGETDWKVIGVSKDNKYFDNINDISDINIYYPNKLNEIREWFKKYKTAEGKSENKLLYDGKYMNNKFAKTVINETYNNWKNY